MRLKIEPPAPCPLPINRNLLLLVHWQSKSQIEARMCAREGRNTHGADYRTALWVMWFCEGHQKTTPQMSCQIKILLPSESFHHFTSPSSHWRPPAFGLERNNKTECNLISLKTTSASRGHVMEGLHYVCRQEICKNLNGCEIYNDMQYNTRVQKNKKTTEAVSASTTVWLSAPPGHQGALETP